MSCWAASNILFDFKFCECIKLCRNHSFRIQKIKIKINNLMEILHSILTNIFSNFVSEKIMKPIDQNNDIQDAHRLLFKCNNSSQKITSTLLIHNISKKLLGISLSPKNLKTILKIVEENRVGTHVFLNATEHWYIKNRKLVVEWNRWDSIEYYIYTSIFIICMALVYGMLIASLFTGSLIFLPLMVLITGILLWVIQISKENIAARVLYRKFGNRL